MEKIREIIDTWTNNKYYTFQLKKFYFASNPNLKNEYLFRFTINLNSYFCESELIPIELTSEIFQTFNVSNNSLYHNENGDGERLTKFLADFDEEFKTLVEDKTSNCNGTLFTSDPVFFK